MTKRQKTASVQALQQVIQTLQKQREEHQAEMMLLNDKIELQQRLIENQEKVIAGYKTLIELLKLRYPNIPEELEPPEKPN